MGYWIVFPVLLVLAERVNRFVQSFVSHPARLEALDDGTVVIIVEKPEGQKWRARAGQYVRLTYPGHLMGSDADGTVCVCGRSSYKYPLWPAFSGTPSRSQLVSAIDSKCTSRPTVIGRRNCTRWLRTTRALKLRICESMSG